MQRRRTGEGGPLFLCEWFHKESHYSYYSFKQMIFLRFLYLSGLPFHSTLYAYVTHFILSRPCPYFHNFAQELSQLFFQKGLFLLGVTLPNSLIEIMIFLFLSEYIYFLTFLFQKHFKLKNCEKNTVHFHILII